MPTKLGDVSIKLKLDASDVEKELASLEGRVRAMGERAPSQQIKWRSIEEGPAGRAKRGPEASWRGRAPAPRNMTQKQIARYFERQERDRSRQDALLDARESLRRRVAATRVAPGGGAQISSRLPTAGELPGAREAMKRLGLGGMQTVNPATTASAAAAIYVGIRTAALNAPQTVSGMEAAFGTKLPGLKRAAIDLYTGVAGFESHVAAYTTGLEKTQAMREAVGRVTGEAPTIPVAIRIPLIKRLFGVPDTLGVTSTSAYYKFFQEAETREGELDKAFERFKDQEFGNATGEFMRKSLKAAFNQ